MTPERSRKVPEIPYFSRKKTDESEKECYNSNVAAGKRYLYRTRGANTGL